VSSNISLICTEAGVSRPTFYHYFPTKYAVINELLAVVVKEMVAAMMPFLDRDPGITPSQAYVRASRRPPIGGSSIDSSCGR
jgi:TetR/AcrR family transcriptional regulator, ethionamide resistance regulator